MNKERFHNALALALGYERILNDKRYNIIVDEKADEPKIIIKDANGYIIIKFKVSEIGWVKQKGIYLRNDIGTDKDIRMIVDAVHQAYIKVITQAF